MKISVKRQLSFMAIIAGVLLLPGCFGGGEAQKVESLKVINVLDKQYYDDCHIPGSIHISMMDVVKTAEKEQWPKSTKIVVYCSNYACTASTSVCKQLMKKGYEHVWDYDPGMAGWHQAGLPVDGPAQEAYLKQENKQLEGANHGNVHMIETKELNEMIQGEK